MSIDKLSHTSWKCKYRLAGGAYSFSNRLLQEKGWLAALVKPYCS